MLMLMLVVVVWRSMMVLVDGGLTST